MSLAAAFEEFPGAARADLQRFYGLNIDKVGADFTIFHAAECMAYLPPECALLSTERKGVMFGITDYVLWKMLGSIAGQKVPFPWEESEERGNLPKFKHQTKDQYLEWYEGKFAKEA